jgi:hypothetical protein
VRVRERVDEEATHFNFNFFFKKNKNYQVEMARWRAGIVPRCAPGQMLATWPIRNVY